MALIISPSNPARQALSSKVSKVPAGGPPVLTTRISSPFSPLPALRTVLDRRGQWLAARNPAWAWAAVEKPHAATGDWEHLPSRQRAEFLCGRVQARSFARANADFRAVCSQGGGNGAAEPAGGPHHQGLAALKS